MPLILITNYFQHFCLKFRSEKPVMLKNIFLLTLLLQAAFGFNQTQAASYFSKAESLKKNQQLDSAVIYYQYAATAYYKSDSIPQCVQAWNLIGVVLTRQDRYDEALVFLDSALTLGLTLTGSETVALSGTYI